MATTVSFTLARADVLPGFWVSLRSRPFALAQIIGLLIVLPWAVAVWLVVDAAHGAAYVSTMSIVEMALLPLLSVLWVVAIQFWMSRGSRMIGGHYRLAFTDDDIRLTSPGIDSRIQWSSLKKCFGLRHGNLFYSGNRPMVSIPGRALVLQAAAESREMSAVRGVTIVGPWGDAPVT
jgi:hypothetical protein